MQRFAYMATLFAGIQLLLLVGGMTFYPRNTGSFLAACLDKHELARTAPSPRLLLVGGSNVSFGTISPFVERQLDRRAVNLGGMGSHGLEYQLREAADFLQPGDVVVLSPEYQSLCATGGSVEALTLCSTLEAEPATIRYMDWPARKAVLDGAHLWLRDALWRTARRVKNGQWPEPPVYSRTSFNRQGDVVVHYDMAAKGPGARPFHLRWSSAELIANIQRLNAFTAQTRANGAECFLFYPAIPAGLSLPVKDDLNSIDETIRANLNMSVLNTPQEMVYPDEMFFDTSYHLSRQGAQRRTLLLIDRLRIRGL